MDPSKSIRLTDGSFYSPILPKESVEGGRRETYRAKKEAFKEEIRKKAEKVKNPTITAKKLALILGDTFIQKTGLEGGKVADYAENWQYLLDRGEKKTALFDLGIEPEKIAMMRADLDDLLASERKLDAGKVDGLIKLIENGLNNPNRKRFALTAKYAGTESDPTGHVFAIIFTVDKENRLICHILNKGEGSHFHPTLELKGKEKRSYHYDPIIFENKEKVIDDRPLFETLVQYATVRAPDDRPYSSTEIYRHLEKKGRLGIDLKGTLLEEAVTSQRSGTCPMQLFRLAARHLLLNSFSPSNYSEQLKKYRRLPIYEKAHALFDAYCLLKNNPDAIELDLVHDSLSAFQLSLKKGEKEILTDREAGLCDALSELMEEKIIHLRQEKKGVKDLEDFDQLEKSHGQHFFDFPHLPNLSDRWEFPKILSITKEGIQIPPPSQLAAKLEELCKFKLPSMDSAFAIYSLIRHLPPPTDDYWEHIPRSDVDRVLAGMIEVQKIFADKLKEMSTGDKTQAGFLHWILLHQLTSYGIALRLADRSPSLKMKNFSPPSLYLINQIHRRFHFHTADDTMRWKKIVGDIKTLQSQRQNRKKLGLWDTEGNSAERLEGLLNGFNTKKAGAKQQHIQYVNQFREERGPLTKEQMHDLLQGPIGQEGNHEGALPSNYYRLEESYYRTALLLQDHHRASVDAHLSTSQERFCGRSGKTYQNRPGSIEVKEEQYWYYYPRTPRRTVEDHSRFRAGEIKDPLFNQLLEEARGQGTENQIVVDTYRGESRQDKSIYHAFEKILRFDNLSASALTEWCEENGSALQEPDNRHFIEILFLRDEKLIKKIREEPHFSERLQKMVKVQLERHVRNRNGELALFWARLGIHLETHIRKASPSSKDREYVVFLLDQLDLLCERLKDSVEEKMRYPLWDRDIFLHKAYISALSQPNKESVARCVADLLHSSYAYHHEKVVSPPWVMHELYRQSRDQCYFSSFQAGIKEGIITFLQRIGIEKMKGATWDFTDTPVVWVTQEEETYGVDLREGIVTQNGLRLWQESIPWETLNAWESEEVKRFSHELVKRGPGHFATPNGRFVLEVDRERNDLRIKKRTTFGGKSDLYTYQRKAKIAGLSEDHPLVSDCVLWKGPERDKNFLTMIVRKDGTRLAQASCDFEYFGGDKWVLADKIYRVDANGAVIKPLERAVLFDSSSEKSWLGLMKEVASPQQTLFWTRGKNKKIHKIELPPVVSSLRLTVVRDEGGKTRHVSCDNLGGEYVLSRKQDRSLVNDVSGSLVFESLKAGGSRILMLPCKRLKWTGHAYVGGKLEPKDFLFLPEKGKENYFFYEIDEKHQMLHHPSTEAMLYLIYVLLMQRDYQRAEEYIKQFQTLRFFTKREQELIETIFNSLQKDLHPKAISLRLKLCVLLIETEQMARAQQKKPAWEIEKSFPLLAEDMVRYLDLAGRSEASQIPRSLHLDPGERKKIINFLCRQLGEKVAQYPALSDERKAINSRVKSTKDFPDPHQHIEDVMEQWLFEKNGFQSGYLTERFSKYIRDITLRNGQDVLNYNFYPFLERIIKDPERKDPKIDDDLLRLFLQKDGGKNSDYSSHLKVLMMARKYPESFCAEVRDKLNAFILRKDWDSKIRAPYFEAWEKGVKGWMEERFRRGTSRRRVPISRKSVTIEPNKDNPSKKAGRRLTTLVGSYNGSNAKKPFDDVGKEFFPNPVIHPVLPPGNEKFVLSQEEIDQLKDPLAVEIGSQIKEAHENTNRNKTYLSYSLSRGKTLGELKDTIRQKIVQANEEMEAIKEEIEKVANGGDRMEHIQLRGGQRERLTVHDLLFHPNHPHLLLLSDTEKKALQRTSLEYMKWGCFINQGERALIEAETGDPQKVAEVLDVERRYDPEEDPELMMYEYFSGNHLRNEPDQAEILRNIFRLIFSKIPSTEKQKEIRKLFFEFQAGGGKTKVLSTIIALRAINEGKQPVFFSLPDLHDVAKVDLRDSLSRFFKVRLNVIELTLLDQPSNEALQAMEKQIRRSLMEGKCDVITTETWHSLHLNYQEAQIEGNETRLTLLTKILDHYRHHGIFLIDEGHVNLDALLRANVAFGDPLPLPEAEQRLYLDIWKALVGVGKWRLMKGDKPFPTEQLGILENEQAIKSKKCLGELKEALADLLCRHPIAQNLNEEKKKELKEDFFLDHKKAPPLMASGDV